MQQNETNESIPKNEVKMLTPEPKKPVSFFSNHHRPSPISSPSPLSPSQSRPTTPLPLNPTPTAPLPLHPTPIVPIASSASNPHTLAFCGSESDSLEEELDALDEQVLANMKTKKEPNDPQQIHLSITKDPRQMVIMWLTMQSTPSSVCRYGIGKQGNDSDDEDETEETEESFSARKAQQVAKDDQRGSQGKLGKSKFVTIGTWSGWFHSVKLKNLKTDTVYIYNVGCSETKKFSDDYSFKTRPNGPFPFTMVTFADFDTMNEIRKKKTVIARLNRNLSEFDIILEFGDICYANGDQAVWDMFFNHIEPIAACKPWMVTVGNHENEKPHGFSAFENRFKMPGRNKFWYCFDYGFAHFVVVSTEHPLEPGSDQHNWIVKTLERANQRRDQVPWIIITGHRALYGSNTRWFHKEKCLKQREYLVPVIDKYQVDIALFGHCHAYERSHPLKNGQVDPRGTIYLLAGVAGATLDKEWKPQPQWSAYRTAHHGYGLFHVKSGKKLRFCYHRERDGKMWDAFTLKKRKGGKKEVRYDYESKFLNNWITLKE